MGTNAPPAGTEAPFTRNTVDEAEVSVTATSTVICEPDLFATVSPITVVVVELGAV
jgi:hypothetical protein